MSGPPDNADVYKSDLFLYKCKTDYHLDSDSNECVPDSCYERCETCTEIGTGIDNQKCLTCKSDYVQEGENCVVPPSTETLPPSTETLPPSTESLPPSTITILPTTAIAYPSTVIIIPTTIINQPTTQIPEIQYIETCKNERCLKCSVDSDVLHLCTSCDETKYKKVNYTREFSSFFDCIKEEKLINKFYKDISTDQYKPCYELCKKCLGPGNATVHNCLECAENYMFRPGPNPYNNCVVYSEYYYLSPYNEYKPLDSPQCPEEAKYSIKYDNNKTSCIFDCKADSIYKYLYNGYCLKKCPSGTSNNNNFVCIERDPDQIYISIDDLYLNNNTDTISIIEILTEKYATEFNYTSKHISIYKTKEEDYSILLYKSPGILRSTNLKVPDIDFGDCYEEVKKAYNITKDLIVALAEKKVNNNPSTYYLFFHPESGIKLEVGDICKNKTIQVKENLLSMLDEKSEKYELQTALTKQGINIFDINDPYYKDICYDFDNPKKRDMALKDRVKETYANVSLCDDGCVNTGIDLINNVAECDCKFNDVTNNDLIHDNAALEYLVGEVFDIIHSSNILVMKCYKYILIYFTRSIGGIIIISLIALCFVFT